MRNNRGGKGRALLAVAVAMMVSTLLQNLAMLCNASRFIHAALPLSTCSRGLELGHPTWWVNRATRRLQQQGVR